MLVHYFAAHNQHCCRAVLQNFRPLPFEKFMALSKHLNALQ